MGWTVMQVLICSSQIYDGCRACCSQLIDFDTLNAERTQLSLQIAVCMCVSLALMLKLKKITVWLTLYCMTPTV